MEYCIIMCRSITYAQRALKVLEREGLRGTMSKAPQGVTTGGCSYGVKIAAGKCERALGYLKASGIRIGKIYALDERGNAREVGS